MNEALSVMVQIAASRVDVFICLHVCVCVCGHFCVSFVGVDISVLVGICLCVIACVFVWSVVAVRALVCVCGGGGHLCAWPFVCIICETKGVWGLQYLKSITIHF